ncbi:MAG: LysM peptidoglycan-binding domain-containing protein [bacterium]|nr:LysM peptidoglycan-binding domain-containing protein [bacterium]
MFNRIAAALGLLLCIAACSLTAPEPGPILVTVTPPPVTATGETATPVPQLATRPPTNTPLPTDLPCTPRDDWFVYTVSAGDTLTGIAMRAGAAADALALANCIDPDTPLNASEGVRVPVAILPPPTPTENADCPERWFFVFRPGKSEVTASCADPVIGVEASGQDFEGGRMLRYAPIASINQGGAPGSGGLSGAVIFVLYHNGFWEEYPDTWDASQPAIDDAISAPPGRVQPSEGFGRVWRENPQVRAALGWAYSAPISFSGRAQFPARRLDYWYLDYGSARLAVRMTRSDVAPNPWEIAGEYE